MMVMAFPNSLGVRSKFLFRGGGGGAGVVVNGVEGNSEG